MGFIDECKKLDRLIKKQFGPKASFNWGPLHRKALHHNLKPTELKETSVIDVVEWVGVHDRKERMAARPPPKPDIKAPNDEWFKWFHIVTDEFKHKMTLKELAEEMGLSYGYVRQKHQNYQAQHKELTKS